MAGFINVGSHMDWMLSFNKLARRDVLTGLVPQSKQRRILICEIPIPLLICGICTRSTPVRYRITDTTVDADLFSMEIESAIGMRFLRAGDMLILDNAANHTGKGTSVLEEWLWQEHMVLALFLPARAPEWNPIELMWNCLAQRLKYFDLSSITGSHRVVVAAATILNEISYEEIYRFYKKSGVFTLHGHKK